MNNEIKTPRDLIIQLLEHSPNGHLTFAIEGQYGDYEIGNINTLLGGNVSVFLKKHEEDKWLRPEDVTEFSEIRILLDGPYNADGSYIERISGMLGYALKANMAGEELSQPTVTYDAKRDVTKIDFYYDSTKSRRDDWYLGEAVEAFLLIYEDGTPKRKTTRTGPIGSQLIEGFSRPFPGTIYFR